MRKLHYIIMYNGAYVKPMEKFSAACIGAIIKNHRKNLGLTQFEVAEQVEIDGKQLGKIERGIHFPSVPTFLRLIRILNIDISEFYSVNINNTGSALENKLMRLIHLSSENNLNLAYKILEVLKSHNN